MSAKIQRLLELAHAVSMTSEERENQRRSFVYGNTKIENDRVTREIVDREADRLIRKYSD